MDQHEGRVMGARGTRAAGRTAGGAPAGRGAGFRLRFGAAVGALALLSTGVILAVGGGRPDSAISLSRGQLTLTLGGIFLAGVLSAALLAWALAGHRHATREPGADRTPVRTSRRAVAAPAPGTRAALRSTRRRRVLR